MNIILIGHKGAGKTTLGEKIAAKKHLTFLDLDHLLLEDMKHTGTIASLYEQLGDKNFRLKEHDLLKKLKLSNTVLATGGGVILYEKNRALLKSLGHIIYLHCSYELLQARLQSLPKEGVLSLELDPRESYKQRDLIYRSISDCILTEIALNFLIS